MTAKRVIFEVRGRKSVLLTAPPFPKPGDVLRIDGQELTVKTVRDEEVIAVFKPEGGTLRQIFPSVKRKAR